MLEAKWLVGKRAGLGLNVRVRGVDGLGHTDLRVLQIVGNVGVSQEGVSKDGDVLGVGVGKDSKSARTITSGEDQLRGSGSDGDSGKVEVDGHVSVTVNVNETSRVVGGRRDTERVGQRVEGVRRNVGEGGSGVKNAATLAIDVIAAIADTVVVDLQILGRGHGQNNQVSAVLGVVDTTHQQGTSGRGVTVQVQRVDESVNVSGILKSDGEVGVLRISSQRLLLLDRDTEDTGASSSAASTSKLKVGERNATSSESVGSPVSIGVSRHVLDEVVIADVGVGGRLLVVELTSSITFAEGTVVGVGDVVHPQIGRTSVQQQVEVLNRSSQTNSNGIVSLLVGEGDGDGLLSRVQVLVNLRKLGVGVVSSDREGHDLGVARSSSDKSKERSEEGGGELHGCCYSEDPVGGSIPIIYTQLHSIAFITHGINTCAHGTNVFVHGINCYI